jgi:flagellar assembly protein FliH
MATVIKGGLAGSGEGAYHFTDLGRQRETYLEQAREEAAALLTAARTEAQAIRAEAQQQGHAAGLASAQRIIDAQAAAVVDTLRPVLQQISTEMTQVRQSWLAQWEQQAVELSTAIASRVIRCELSRQPNIPITLVAEALKLVAGKPEIRVLLNPEDHRQLGDQIRSLAADMAGVCDATIVADASVTRGGCRIDTRHGTIDQSIEAQLKRIERELV